MRVCVYACVPPPVLLLPLASPLPLPLSLPSQSKADDDTAVHYGDHIVIDVATSNRFRSTYNKRLSNFKKKTSHILGGYLACDGKGDVLSFTVMGGTHTHSAAHDDGDGGGDGVESKQQRAGGVGGGDQTATRRGNESSSAATGERTRKASLHERVGLAPLFFGSASAVVFVAAIWTALVQSSVLPAHLIPSWMPEVPTEVLQMPATALAAGVVVTGILIVLLVLWRKSRTSGGGGGGGGGGNKSGARGGGGRGGGSGEDREREQARAQQTTRGEMIGETKANSSESKQTPPPTTTVTDTVATFPDDDTTVVIGMPGGALTPEETAMLVRVREHVKDLEGFTDDVHAIQKDDLTLIRFIRARNLDFDKVVEMWKNHMQVRRGEKEEKRRRREHNREESEHPSISIRRSTHYSLTHSPIFLLLIHPLPTHPFSSVPPSPIHLFTCPPVHPSTHPPVHPSTTHVHSGGVTSTRPQCAAQRHPRPHPRTSFATSGSPTASTVPTSSAAPSSTLVWAPSTSQASWPRQGWMRSSGTA